MAKEREVTLLNIDEKELKEKIEKLGGEKVGEFLQRRFVYDLIPVRKNSWIRLRTNGSKTTLTIKEIKDKTAIGGTEELEIEVDDFDKTNQIMEKLGFIARNYQENYRCIYNFKKVEISIDSWPMIPTYAEIEGKTDKDVIDTLKELGYKLEDATTLDVESIYREIYGINILNIKELKFEGEK